MLQPGNLVLVIPVPTSNTRVQASHIPGVERIWIGHRIINRWLQDCMYHTIIVIYKSHYLHYGQYPTVYRIHCRMIYRTIFLLFVSYSIDRLYAQYIVLLQCISLPYIYILFVLLYKILNIRVICVQTNRQIDRSIDRQIRLDQTRLDQTRLDQIRLDQIDRYIHAYYNVGPPSCKMVYKPH